jgi:hypothetical protein
MYVLLTGFMILNLLFGFVDYIIVGQTDIYVTELTVAVSENTTTLNVDSTAGFRVADYVRIGDEKIAYNGKTDTSFTYATRGYDSTEPAAHDIGDNVYGRVSDALNTSVGFNIIDTGASVGTINTISMVTRFATTTLPQMVQWNFYFMKEGFWVYLRLLCASISGALIFIVGIQVLSALGGLLQSAFRR